MKVKGLEEFQIDLAPPAGGRRVMLNHSLHCGFSKRYPELPTSAVSLARIARDARDHLKMCRPGKDAV